MAQKQNVIPVKQDSNGSFNTNIHCLKMPEFKRAGPSLGNFGKGLQYYDLILRQNDGKKDLTKHQHEGRSMVVISGIDEIDKEIFRQNMLFIGRECQDQVREWMKKDKWDLNLGEAIKGFYQTPVF